MRLRTLFERGCHPGHLLKHSNLLGYSTRSNLAPVPLAHDIFENSESGSQPSPLLLTHGLLGSKNNWKSISKAVTKETNRKTIIFDLRNHGESPHVSEMTYEIMAEDISLLAKTLGLSKFALLGHSMGGRAALTFALKYPELIEKLVIVDVTHFNFVTDFSKMSEYIEMLMSIKFNAKQTLSEARKMADQELIKIEPDDSLRAFLLTNLGKNESGPYWRSNLPVLLDFLKLIGSFPAEHLKNQFNGPTLFIRGENSPYIPPETFPKTKVNFPNANLVTIKKAGHWPHADNPKDFIPALVNFLKSN